MELQVGAKRQKPRAASASRDTAMDMNLHYFRSVDFSTVPNELLEAIANAAHEGVMVATKRGPEASGIAAEYERYRKLALVNLRGYRMRKLGFLVRLITM